MLRAAEGRFGTLSSGWGGRDGQDPPLQLVVSICLSTRDEMLFDPSEEVPVAGAGAGGAGVEGRRVDSPPGMLGAKSAAGSVR